MTYFALIVLSTIVLAMCTCVCAFFCCCGGLHEVMGSRAFDQMVGFLDYTWYKMKNVDRVAKQDAKARQAARAARRAEEAAAREAAKDVRVIYPTHS